MGTHAYESSFVDQAMVSMKERIQGLIGIFQGKNNSEFLESQGNSQSEWLKTL
jgi:hypothetical protein